MTKKLVIYSWRGGREKTGRTMTVGDLINYLSEFDDELPVYVEGYDGYQSNGIGWADGSIEEIDD